MAMITKRNPPPPRGSSGQRGRSGIPRHTGMITSGEKVRPTPTLQRPNILTQKPTFTPNRAKTARRLSISSGSVARAPHPTAIPGFPRGTPAGTSARGGGRPYLFPGNTPHIVPVPTMPAKRSVRRK